MLTSMVAPLLWFAVRLFLAGVFLVAGLAKLSSPASVVHTLRAFGVRRLLAPLAIALPVAELLTTGGLLLAPTAWYAAWGALGLLVLFSGGIAANLLRGHQPACNCFGQLHAVPISGRTLLRNGLLAACAAGLVAAGPPPPTADLWALFLSLEPYRRTVVVVGALFALLVIGAIVRPPESPSEADVDEAEDTAAKSGTDAAAARATAAAAPPAPRRAPAAPEPPRRDALGRTLTGIGLPAGTPAPAFDLPDLAGTRHSLASLQAGGTPLVLLFSSPNCHSCQFLVPKLPALAEKVGDALRLVLVSRGTVAQNVAKLPDPGRVVVLLQQEYEVAEQFDCTTTPAAVAVGADGLVQNLLAVGAQDIDQVITRTAAAGRRTEDA